jgi:carboxypeptidase D
MREFVLGSNATGLVTQSSGSIVVVGGDNSTLAEDILPGGDEVFYGSGATQSTYVAPSATRAAWRSFIRTETAIPTAVNAALSSNVNAARRVLPSGWLLSLLSLLSFLGFRLQQSMDI